MTAAHDVVSATEKRTERAIGQATDVAASTVDRATAAARIATARASSAVNSATDMGRQAAERAAVAAERGVAGVERAQRVSRMLESVGMTPEKQLAMLEKAAKPHTQL